MEKSSFLSMTFNNIVFKGRNKAYGAYKLRKAYNKHMTQAYILATAIFSGALVGPLVESIFFANPVKYEKPVLEVYSPIDILKPLPPKTPEPEQTLPVPASERPEQAVATEKYVPAKVVPDKAQIEEESMPDQSDLLKVSIGKNKLDGEIPDVPSTFDTGETTTGVEGGTAETERDLSPHIYVEQMPEFEGGEKALVTYLSRKLRYPQAAQSSNIEGTVVVSFVVGTSGEISQIEIIKGLGFGTEEEAERVIKSMPKWKPGKQNGRAVPVRYTLPIKFSLQ